MGSLMPTEMLFSKKASPAVAQMTLSRGGPHLSRLELSSPTSHPRWTLFPRPGYLNETARDWLVVLAVD